MPGPKTEAEARTWIQEAVAAGRYVAAGHFWHRAYERDLTLDDVLRAVEHMVRLERYAREPVHDGTCWRVLGPNVDDDRTIAVGVEAFLDKKRRRVLLATFFEVSER
jgi:hypothetical protein